MAHQPPPQQPQGQGQGQQQGYYGPPPGQWYGPPPPGQYPYPPPPQGYGQYPGYYGPPQGGYYGPPQGGQPAPGGAPPQPGQQQQQQPPPQQWYGPPPGQYWYPPPGQYPQQQQGPPPPGQHPQQGPPPPGQYQQQQHQPQQPPQQQQQHQRQPQQQGQPHAPPPPPLPGMGQPMRAPVTQQFPRFPPVNLKNFNLDMRKRFQENEATFEKGLKDVEACFGITGVTFQADYDELYQQASERCKVLVPCIAQYPSAWVTNLKAWGTLDKPANKRCMMLTWTTKRMGFRLTESTHRDDRFYTEFKDGVMWFVSSKDYILNGFDVIGGRAPRGTMTDNDMSLDVLLDYDANVPKMKQHIAELEEAIGVTGLSFVVEDWKAYEAAYVVKMVQTPNCVWSSLYDGYLADLTRWLKGHCQRDPMNKEAIRDALSGKKIIFRVRKGAEFNKRKIKNMSASYHVEYFEDGNLVIEANADEAASVGSIGEYILSQL